LENWDLPPELKPLERDLTERLQAAPSPGLAQRVVVAVRAELRRDRMRRRWAFAAGAAAAVLVWANLSLSAAQATDYDLRLGSERQPVLEVAEQIRQLLPEISQREALRQAVLLQAGVDLRRHPGVPAPPAARDRLGDFDDLLR